MVNSSKCQCKCVFLNERAYQWRVILYWAWLVTLTTMRSPSTATTLGPGNLPLTVTMLLVLHSLVTFCNRI